MQTFLTHPAFQGGIAPLGVGLIAVALLGRVRLGGLAVAAALCVAVALISGLSFTPLNATRKIVVLALLAPIVGVVIDLARKPGPSVAVASAFGALTVWVFWSVLQHKALASALALAVGTGAFMAWLVAATMDVSAEPLRAGAAALALGVG